MTVFFGRSSSAFVNSEWFYPIISSVEGCWHMLVVSSEIFMWSGRVGSIFKSTSLEPVPSARFRFASPACSTDSWLAGGSAPWTPGGYIPIPTTLSIPVPNTFFIYILSYQTFFSLPTFSSLHEIILILWKSFILANISPTHHTHIWSFFCL